MYKKICRKCSKPYETEEDKLIFCSTDCEKAAKKERYESYVKDEIRKNIPLKYRDIESDRKDLINRFIGSSLFITGSSGVGKTVLMASIVKRLIREEKEVCWIGYSSFIMGLQSMFKQDRGEKTVTIGDYIIKESPYDYVDRIACFKGFLCIDDIGAEKLTDFVRQITYYIVNEREQWMLPLIITSNFSLAQIDEMIDPRISSRIAGMCETIKLTGKDRRLKNV